MTSKIFLIPIRFIILFCGLQSLWAQQSFTYTSYTEVRGQIVDGKTGEPLPYVQINNVYKHPQHDSIVVKITITDVEGKFTITTPKVNQNRIEAVCMGYKMLEKNLVEVEYKGYGGNVTFNILSQVGKLKMEPDVHLLDEVVVRSRIRLYEMRGDTAYIFPKLIKVSEGEPLIELMRRHPMFDVRDNNDVYIDGQRVERIKLNEKLLFGDDARAAITTLLAGDAQLIKAYDEVDEVSEILVGSERAKKRKVLDIISFRHFKKIQDANMTLEGGRDKKKNEEGKHKNHYFAGINGGIFNEQVRMSLKATIDNFPGTDKHNSYKFQRQGSNDLYHRRGEGDFKIEKSSPDLLKRFSTNYFFRHKYTENQNNYINTYYPTPSFNHQYQENVTQNNDDLKRHTIRLEGTFTKKQSHSISFKLNTYLNDNKKDYFTFNQMIQNTELLSLTKQQNYNKVREYTISPSFSYTTTLGHKLGALNFYIDASFSNKKNYVIRTDSLQSFNYSNYRILDVNSKTPQKNVRVRWGWTLPIKWLKYNSYLDYSDKDNRRMYINRLSGLIDTLMSEDVSERFLKIRNDFYIDMLNKKNHTLSFGITYNIVKIWRNECFPISWEKQMTFHLLNPMIFYAGRFGQTQFDFSLEAGQETIQSWSIADFSSRLNVKDPLFVRGGNPNLKLPNRYDFSLRVKLPYRLNISFQDTYIKNGIVLSNISFDKNTYLPEYNYHILAGATLQKPTNIAGYHELQTTLNYSKMLSLFFSMKTTIGYTYRNPQAIYNNRLGREKDQSGYWDLYLNSNLSYTLFLTLKNRMNFNHYTNADGLTNKRFSNSISLESNWEITYRFFIKSDYTYRFQNNSVLEHNINEQILNASIGIKLFENHRGKLTFMANDILNNQKNITTSATNMYVQTKHNFLNSSYFAVSFEYRLSNQ